MALESGSRLGPYEIGSRLGAGGMGEVYRARDARLGRTVAIKVLRGDIAHSAEHRARFEREARTISSLEHPHICSLYDVGRKGEIDFLVMQFVEGDTLARRLEKARLPLDQVFRYAIDVADAVAAAHKRGIVHRDLKPSNIILAKSGAIVLDFGLAKLWGAATTSDEVETAARQPELTSQGAILGTLPYMAPELLEGKEADPRSDIFAFGAVLYEMVTAKKAFSGRGATELVAAILGAQPAPAAALNPLIPPVLDHMLQRCLAKDPEERWQSMSDIGEELKWAGGTASPTTPAATKGRRVLPSWALLGVGALTGAALVASLLWWRRADPIDTAPAPPARFTIPLAEGESLHVYSSASVAMSPDGTHIAYAANRGAERAIYVRALDELESRRLAGTERANDPIFSPDGEWVAFEAAGKLKKVSLKGGSPQFLANLVLFGGHSWGTGDIIGYTPAYTGGLFAISAQGGKPRRLTTPEKNRAHIWPEVLPGGKAVLFTLWRGENTFDQSHIGVLSLETGKWNVVIEGGFYARYAPTGHLLFVRGGSLFAAPFDLSEQRVTGASVPVLEGVLQDSFDGAGQFAVSRTGSLVYASGTAHSPGRRLVWVDRSGRRSTITSTSSSYSLPRLSPDGRRLGLSSWADASVSVWVYGLAQDTLTRVSFGSDDHNVAWSPDSRRVAFESGRDGVHQIYVRSADGTGDDDQVTTGEHNHYLCDWSRDGQALAYAEFHPDTGADLWVVEAQGTRQARPFLNTSFWEKQATFSPNGRWLAYVSDESGEFEVYMRPFPGPGPRFPISSEGGEEPAWSRSGRELFYRSSGRMMSVTISETPELSASRPQVLFEGLYHYADLPTRTYDVGPDGRFVMVTEPAPDEATRQLHVVLNWSEELKRPANR